MATVKVKVPNEPGRRQSFVYEASTVLDAGNDILFVNDADDTVESLISRIMLDTDGAVKYRSKFDDDADAATQTFVSGGYHNIGLITKLFATGTDTGLNLHVSP